MCTEEQWDEYRRGYDDGFAGEEEKPGRGEHYEDGYYDGIYDKIEGNGERVRTQYEYS